MIKETGTRFMAHIFTVATSPFHGQFFSFVLQFNNKWMRGNF